MSVSNTSIVNMALSKIGAKTINDLDTDTSVPAVNARIHFEQTRDSLLRSHWWRFASARATLSQDTVSPDFEYDNQFLLPADFLRAKSIFGDNATAAENIRFNYAIEGQKLLTDEGSVELRYIKRVTDASKFDPLFIELLVLSLALKLIGPLAGGAPKLQTQVQNELRLLMPKVRALDRQETNTIGRLNRRPWVESRVWGGGSWRQDRV